MREHDDQLDNDTNDVTGLEDASLITVDESRSAANKDRKEINARRNIEDILEQRRLQAELDDEFGFSSL